MSRSAIYTANTNTNSVTDGNSIPLGNIIRRFGCNLDLNGTEILLKGTGYYDVDTNISFTGTATGSTTITIYKDGVAVPGATVTRVTAADTTYQESIPALVRNTCCRESTLSLVVTGTTVNVTNVGVVVERE